MSSDCIFRLLLHLLLLFMFGGHVTIPINRPHLRKSGKTSEMKGIDGTPLATAAMLPSPVLLWRLKDQDTILVLGLVTRPRRKNRKTNTLESYESFCIVSCCKLRLLMAKTKPGKKDLDSYTIKGTNKVVRPGDCVLMRPSDSDKPLYVARIEKLEADHRNNVKVRVRWYYRPEESTGGQRQFHGVKELFLSDHYDMQSAHTIEGKCIVHTFKNYTKLDNVGAEDYFCRFEYKAAAGCFIPDRVAVYCKCEMPYNPDDLMIQCEGCKDWFHPNCMGMAIEEAKKLDLFLCSDCSSVDDAKRPSNA
ncbi:hypothetical protein R6Q57_006383 [Mikania cordata]